MINIDKESLLAFVRGKLATGELTPADLLSLAGAEVSTAPAVSTPTVDVPVVSEASHHMNLSKVFYYLGGLIVLAGISVFVSQFWQDLGSAGRITVALGSAILAYAIGIILSRFEEQSELGSAFHLIGGALFPFGIYTLLAELSMPVTQVTWIYMFLALTVLYALTMTIVRYPLITFFCVVNASAFLFTLAQQLLQGSFFVHWYDYFGIIMGGSYLYLGYAFINTRNQALCRIMFFFGSLWVLGSAFALFDSLPFWLLLYPILIAGMVALSLFVKRMSMLVITTISLMAYIAYVTGKYFVNSIGWPLALIIVGLLFVGTGYLTFYLNRTYIAVRK